MPRVSVVMPTYNGVSRGFLPFAIESVLAQSFSNLELIIVDDGSTDGTKELCEGYLVDPRVRYVYQKNSGVSVARNNGIAQSRGEYISFLDDDDVWVPEKLEKQFEIIERVDCKMFGLCYSALACIDCAGERTGAIQSHHASGNVFFKMLCENIVDCTSSVLTPRSVLEDVGDFDVGMSHAEDYDLWLRIAKKYNVYSVDEPLVLYREHGDKLSANLDKIESSALRVVSRMLQEASEADAEVISARVFNRIYKHRARYRFWRGEFGKFREYVRFASRYGKVGSALRVRYWMSYLPRLVRFSRKVSNLSKRFF